MACTGQILIHVVTHEAHPLSAKSHDTKMQKKCSVILPCFWYFQDLFQYVKELLH